MGDSSGGLFELISFLLGFGVIGALMCNPYLSLAALLIRFLSFRLALGRSPMRINLILIFLAALEISTLMYEDWQMSLPGFTGIGTLGMLIDIGFVLVPFVVLATESIRLHAQGAMRKRDAWLCTILGTLISPAIMGALCYIFLDFTR